MAELIDEPLTGEVAEQEKQPTPTLEDTLEAVPEPKVEEEVESTESDDSDLPEKYRNKSIKDIVRMHQEAEKYIGRQSQEVGELRKTVDMVVQNQLAAQAPTKEPEPEPDFLLEPEKAINKAVEEHPAVKEAREATAQLKQQKALDALNRKHPDMKEILQDTQFAEWVGKSPYRMRMFNDADQKYDYEKADELFSMYKDTRQATSATVEAEKASRKAQVKQASTGSARGSDAPKAKKTYRRADIIRLMQNDPDKYNAMQPEIMAAYAEGRVT